MHVESGLIRLAASLLGLAGLALHGTIAAAQVQVQLLDLTVSRPLTPEELDQLSEIVIQNEVEAAVRDSADEAVSVEDVCTLPDCSRLVRSELDAATEAASDLSAASDDSADDAASPTAWGGNVIISGAVTRDGSSFVVLDPETVPGRSELRAVRIDDTFVLSGGSAVRDLTAAPVSQLVAPTSLPTRIISDDLRRGGESRRTFAIRPDIPQEQVEDVLASLTAPGIDARTIGEDEDQPASLLSPVEVVSFEGAADECEVDASGARWPYDADEVVEIIKFNAAVLERLGIPVARSVILVVDTGVGEPLLQPTGGFLAGLLAPNLRELVNPAVTFVNRLGQPNSRACLDNDGNGYFRDIYGASGADAGFEAQCRDAPFASLPDTRLLPLPRREGTTETYEPNHGSFVAALAAGGPDLALEYPDIRRHVGLRFFRATRPAEAVSTKSVRVEPSDVLNSLKYALAQRVSVVNFSMRTTDIRMRGLFDEVAAANTLVVTSAGNFRENLNASGNRVLPAGLRNRNLLVVGGLTNDHDRSWWPDSAFGNDFVNIAAPSVLVRSVDASGGQVCFTGTSAAAPIVSFTAAVLLSYGLHTAEGAKDRIVGAADVDPSLSGLVRHEKKLNVAAALDIFADRILRSGELLRGRIVTDPDERLIRACSGATGEHLSASQGWIDPVAVRSWRRSDDRAFFEETGMGGVDEPRECSLARDAALTFREFGSTETMTIRLDSVESMILSPFRSSEVEGAVLARGAPE